MTIPVSIWDYTSRCSGHASVMGTPRWLRKASPSRCFFPPRALSGHPSTNAYQVWYNILFEMTRLEKKKSPQKSRPSVPCESALDRRLTHLPPPDTGSCLSVHCAAPVGLGRGLGARMFSVFGRSHVCSEYRSDSFLHLHDFSTNCPLQDSK